MSFDAFLAEVDTLRETPDGDDGPAGYVAVMSGASIHDAHVVLRRECGPAVEVAYAAAGLRRTAVSMLDDGPCWLAYFVRGGRKPAAVWPVAREPVRLGDDTPTGFARPTTVDPTVVQLASGYKEIAIMLIERDGAMSEERAQMAAMVAHTQAAHAATLDAVTQAAHGGGTTGPMEKMLDTALSMMQDPVSALMSNKDAVIQRFRNMTDDQRARVMQFVLEVAAASDEPTAADQSPAPGLGPDPEA